MPLCNGECLQHCGYLGHNSFQDLAHQFSRGRIQLSSGWQFLEAFLVGAGEWALNGISMRTENKGIRLLVRFGALGLYHCATGARCCGQAFRAELDGNLTLAVSGELLLELAAASVHSVSLKPQSTIGDYALAGYGAAAAVLYMVQNACASTTTTHSTTAGVSLMRIPHYRVTGLDILIPQVTEALIAQKHQTEGTGEQMRASTSASSASGPETMASRTPAKAASCCASSCDKSRSAAASESAVPSTIASGAPTDQSSCCRARGQASLLLLPTSAAHARVTIRSYAHEKLDLDRSLCGCASTAPARVGPGLQRRSF